jgi:enoyl-CoA hydratase
MAPPIILDIRDRVAEVIFNHPPVNAFDTAGWELLPRLITAAGTDENVRCVLIRAEGRGFCGGVDIKEMQAHPERIVKLNRDNFLTFKSIHECPVPVVCALHNFVIGGGVNIAGASDALIAADDTYFSLPEIDRGAMGGASYMARILPLMKVRAAFFTGGKVPVADAVRFGAVEKVVSREALLQEARDFCHLIASKSRMALVLAKQALNGLEPRDALHGYRFEQGFTLEMYLHPDSQKARDAFVQDAGKTAKF